MNSLKPVKVLVRKLISVPFLQPLWKGTYKVATRGLNIGGGQEIDSSGELWVISFLIRNNKDNHKLTIFDVGAHHGRYAREIVKRMKGEYRLFCFEPSKSNFDVLKNECIESNEISLFNFGFSNQKEETTLYSFKEGSTVSSVYNQFDGKDVIATEKSLFKTIDEFCQVEEINFIDFLKIDVEGHELKVLQGAQNMLQSQSIKFVQFEFGPPNIHSRTYFKDIFEYLNPYYRIYRILCCGLFPIDKYRYDDEIFQCTNYLAESRDR